jgi:hypothetical protein
MSAENRESDERTAGRQAPPQAGESDDHIGAVEGDRPSDRPQHGNPNAPALDDQGLPDDPAAVCQDVIGANLDETEGG